MSKKTLIIAGFPGVGKSYFCEHGDEGTAKAIDADSSKFSWVKGSKGDSPQRNPDFPKNYIEHIKSIKDAEGVDIIFVSSHKEVRRALKEADIPYILVYPNIYQKSEYIKRYKQRGNSDNFIKKVDSHWDEWIRDCMDETYPVNVQLPYFSVKYLNQELVDLVTLMEDL